MKPETKSKLIEAINYCDDNDKSTEFMIQYVMDFANVSHDCVIRFLEKLWRRNDEQIFFISI